MSSRRSLNHTQLLQKMHAAGIYEKDIEEQFIHASGPGGQNVNKVATCVMVYHRPSGIRVKCQTSRTQLSNRLQARRLLIQRVEQRSQSVRLAKQSALSKKKRQNRKRTKAVKERMLEGKRRQADKKKQRQKVNLRRFD